MTALGPVRLTRAYRTTPDGEGHFPAGEEVGLHGTRTRTARRRPAARPARHDAARFARAEGVIEVAIDAGTVNTRDPSWRDVKVAVISGRTPGEPASADGWEKRALPAPTAAAADVEGSDAFADRVRAETDRLGVTAAADVTVPDFFHVAEAIADAVTAVRGAGGHADGLFARGRSAVSTGGTAGLARWTGEAFLELPAGSDGEPLRGLAAYVAPHPTHLGYAGRLAAGRSIGSGQVEGAIKQLVNRRMKRTGARWRAEHVGPRVELVARIETPEWHEVWTAA